MALDEDVGGEGAPSRAVHRGMGDPGPVEGQCGQQLGEFGQQVDRMGPPDTVDAAHRIGVRGDGQAGDGWWRVMPGRAGPGEPLAVVIRCS